MKVKEITISYARAFNLAHYGGPQYESIRPEASITAELDENDDPEQVIASLNEMAKQAVKAQAAPVLAYYRKKVDEIRSSLPEGILED